MKRFVAALSAVVVFGWMAGAGVCFLAENPGALGFLADPLGQWLGVPPPDSLPHDFLRVIGHLGASLSFRSFKGWPFEILGALMFSVWLFAIFAGTGLRIVRAAGLRDLPPIEAFAVAASLGMGAWGIAVLLLGAVRLLCPAVLIGVLFLATIIVAPVVRDWVKALWRDAPRRPRGMIEWAIVVLASLALALGLVYTLTPAIQSDGLRYHLAAPQAYLREHRIAYLPFNAFTNFPFLIEMLFTLSLAVAGDLAAKMVHFGCFALCGLFAALLVSRLLDGLDREGEASRPRLPLLAALAFWTTPTALLTAAWEFIDLGTALFFVAMIYALARWHQAPLEADKRKWRWIAALFLGFLIGTKYTMLALVFVVPLALLFEIASFAFSRNSAIRNQPSAVSRQLSEMQEPQLKTQNSKFKILPSLLSGLLVGSVAVAVASPWFIKNIVFTRNPVYPLAWDLFDGGEWSAENARFYFDKSSLKGFHPRHDRTFGETLRHIIATPWEATIHWRQTPDARRPGYEDQFLGPLFLLWIPLLLRALMDVKHRAAREGPFRLVALFTIAYVAIWYFTYQSNRLLIPAAATLSVLVGYSIALAERTSRALARGSIVIFLLAAAYNLEWSAEFIFRETSVKPSPAAYWLGFQSRDSYIRRAFPPYAMFQLMPSVVRPGEKVLFVGEYRPGYCSVEWRSSDWFDTPLILCSIRATPDDDALLDRLLDENVKWVFYNDAELAKYERDFFRPRFSEAEWKRFEDLFKREKSADGESTIVAHPRLRAALSESGMSLYGIDQKSR